jgi:predicted nucleic acid-binding protein
LNRALRFYLDSNAVIEILDGTIERGERQVGFLEGIASGRCFAATSELTLAECLIRPIRDGNAPHMRLYEEFLDEQLSAPLVPVTRKVLLLAASIRAGSKAKLPDCIHSASAVALECDIVVSADKSLPVAQGMRRMTLNEIDLDTVGMQRHG